MTDPVQDVDVVTSFEEDNFTSRRTTGHNLFDPDSLLTGGEEAQGLTYDNSSRVFPSAEVREQAIRGEISQADIIRLYPRVLHAQAAD
jgi:hypothetical protein